MRFKALLFTLSCLAGNLFAQDRSIETVLNKLNSHKIPYIYSKDLDLGNKTILLDAREWAEYKVSKIPGAVYVGFNSFDINKIKTLIPNNENKIVVYCSIGIRSEQIAARLKRAGYIHVFNLWGGIFEWKNEGKTVVDSSGIPTERVHAYSKNWGVYLKKGVKVYDK